MYEMLHSIEKRKDKDNCCREPIECNECEKGGLDTTSSESSSDYDDDASSSRAESDDKVPKRKPECWICPNGIPPAPPLTETLLRTPKNCIVCNQNRTWLPKLATCPTCGYKPTPQPQDVAYDDKVTAEQVIEDFANKTSSCSDEDAKMICMFEKNNNKKSRCVCGGAGTCVFCRVRKLAEEAINESTGKSILSRDVECSTCDKNISKLYQTCATDEARCRPFLTRVFSELRLLYDVKSEPKQKPYVLSEKCEQRVRKTWGRDLTAPTNSKYRKEKLNELKKQQSAKSAVKQKFNRQEFKHQRKDQRRCRQLKSEKIK